MAYTNKPFTFSLQPWAFFGLCVSVATNASQLDVDDPTVAEHCELQLGWQQPRSDHNTKQINTSGTCNQGRWEWHLGMEHQRDNGINEQQTELGFKLPLTADYAPWQPALAVNLQTNHQGSHPLTTQIVGILGYDLAAQDLRLYSNLGINQYGAQSPQLIAGLAIAFEYNSEQQWIVEFYHHEPHETAYRFAYQYLLKKQLQLELSLGNNLTGKTQQLGADLTFFFN